nr:oligopeptide/dipeptide ABC transporter ATP-binding protein [Saccharothrix sp. CB00851]
MYAGRVVEGGDSETVTQRPAHPYTQLLIDSAPDPDRPAVQEKDGGTGEPPSLINPPQGCRFNPRCPHAMKVCAEKVPPRFAIGDGEGHFAACWLYGDDLAESDKVKLRVAEVRHGGEVVL